MNEFPAKQDFVLCFGNNSSPAFSIFPQGDQITDILKKFFFPKGGTIYVYLIHVSKAVAPCFNFFGEEALGTDCHCEGGKMGTKPGWNKREWLGGAALILFLTAGAIESFSQTTPGQEKDLARGEYLVLIAGCNDCHTPGFAESGGSLARGEWLTGDRLGWRGPWGTTYPTNLRIYMADISEEGWVKKSRLLKSRPPMPWWVLHTLKDEDTRAMYRFIKSLGRKGQVAPSHVPANQEPRTPHILFVPQPPRR